MNEEQLQETVDWTRGFIQDRLQSPNKQIREAAQAALAKLNNLLGRAVDAENMTPDQIKDYVLGTDSSIYFSPKVITERDRRQMEQDRILQNRGLLDQDGKIKRVWRIPDIAPTSITAANGEKVYSGVPLDQYMSNLYSESPADPMSPFRNRSSNMGAQLFYNFDKDRNPLFRKGEFSVTGEFTGRPDHYDAQYNKRYADAIKNGERPKRYEGVNHYVVMKRDTGDPKTSGLYLYDLDTPPDQAADPWEQDYFPFEGMLKWDDSVKGNANVQKYLDNIRAKSPWSANSDENVHRRNRIQRLETDENGLLTDRAIEKIKSLAVGRKTDGIQGNEGVVYDDIQDVDRATGAIKRFNRIDVDNMLDKFSEGLKSKTTDGNSFSRGGRLRVPKRNSYGDRVSRADNLGTDEYDVYF